MLKKGLMCLCFLILSGCGQGPGAPVVETTVQLYIRAPGGVGSGAMTIHNAGGSTWAKEFSITNEVTVIDYAYADSTVDFSVTFSPAPITIEYYTFGPKVWIDNNTPPGPVTNSGILCDPNFTSATVTIK